MTTLPNWRQKLAVWEKVGYQPNEIQQTFHRCGSRRRLVAGGERAGKSFSVAKEVLALLPFTKLIWLLGPDYEQGRAEFQYLLDDLLALGAIRSDRDVSQPRIGSWWLRTKSGQQIVTRTSANTERIASVAPDGIVMCEAAQQSYEAYLKTYGRLSQNRGWLIAVGTFEGSLGWYPDVFERWKGESLEGGRSFSLPTWSNTHRYPGGREDPEIKILESLYPDDLFMERFGAVPVKPAGLVFKDFDFTKHVQQLETYDNLPVELWIDPGYAGAYAVLAVQVVGSYVHVIDEVYAKGLVAHEVIDRCRARPWWDLVPKAPAVGGVIDIAGLQHHAMPSQVETWAKEAKVQLLYNPVSIEDGIQTVRVMLKDPSSGDPRLFFNTHLDSSKDGLNRANGVLAEFGLYQYRAWKEGQPVTEAPIDANNHALKALGYGLYHHFGAVGWKPVPVPQRRRRGIMTQ